MKISFNPQISFKQNFLITNKDLDRASNSKQSLQGIYEEIKPLTDESYICDEGYIFYVPDHKESQFIGAWHDRFIMPRAVELGKMKNLERIKA